MTTSPQLLLCTDLDRTVIPNGAAPEHPHARRCFRAFCALPEVCLVYVSGRHLQLVEEAIAMWQLPRPDYVITDVGTRIWHMNGPARELDEWPEHIACDWRGKTHADLQALLVTTPGLQLQEASKQNRHKLSFYVPRLNDREQALETVRQRLQQADVQASVVWSIDDLTHTGLVDVLPRHATKLHAILYLQQRLGYRDDEILFAGDSGNDLGVLTSHLPAVLVGNASEEVRQAALAAVQAAGREATLYVAGGGEPEANYSAGVLQGIWHFAPAFRERFGAGACKHG